LGEETMPESLLHDETVTLLRVILAAWAADHRPCWVARNLAVRWDETQPQVGVDPDVAIFRTLPPEGKSVRSVRTWDAGHQPPLLAVEVVSETNPRKDYVLAPEKYAASGTEELWVFDPLLRGPDSYGGPFRLQAWKRDVRGDFVLAYSGDGPARSAALDAYFVIVDEGQKLRLARDPAGTEFYLTDEEKRRAGEEKERAEKEKYRAAEERERAEKEKYRAAEERERAEKEKYRAAEERERAEKEKYRAAEERERAEKEKYRAAEERERSEKEAARARVRELEAELAARSR
jgi:hypothetical protein